ncbi:MAG: DUF222 domain-containing protein [Marmoricola sp.]
MTSTTLDQPTHPILGFARALDGALDRGSSVDPVFMTADDKRAALLALTRERHRLEALWLRVIAAADLDDVGAVDGSTSTGAWLSHHTHADRSEASAQVRLANTLDRSHPDTLQVLGAGKISAKHAEVIAWSLKRLPDDLDPHLLGQAEKVMLDEAHHLTPTQLRHAGKHLLEVIAPDLADELIAKQLEADEQAAYSKVRLSLRNNGDGTTAGYFRLPDFQAGILQAAIEAIIAPRKLGADRIDPATGKRIDYPTLLGQGFCELIEHLPVDALPRHGRMPVTMLVGLDHQVLASALGAAGFGDGDRLSPEQVRRLACNAGIIPVLYGSPSVPVDRGRETRMFTEAQSVLMAIRDHGCRAETCDRPPSWCEAHHWHPWQAGGKTDLADGVLLCGFHHRLAHHTAYNHQRLPNGDVRFTRRC